MNWQNSPQKNWSRSERIHWIPLIRSEDEEIQKQQFDGLLLLAKITNLSLGEAIWWRRTELTRCVTFALTNKAGDEQEILVEEAEIGRNRLSCCWWASPAAGVATSMAAIVPNPNLKRTEQMRLQLLRFYTKLDGEKKNWKKIYDRNHVVVAMRSQITCLKRISGTGGIVAGFAKRPMREAGWARHLCLGIRCVGFASSPSPPTWLPLIRSTHLVHLCTEALHLSSKISTGRYRYM